MDKINRFELEEIEKKKEIFCCNIILFIYYITKYLKLKNST